MLQVKNQIVGEFFDHCAKEDPEEADSYRVMPSVWKSNNLNASIASDMLVQQSPNKFKKSISENKMLLRPQFLVQGEGEVRRGCYLIMNVIAKFPDGEKKQYPNAEKLLEEVFDKTPNLMEVAEKHDFTTGCLQGNYNRHAKDYEKFSGVCRCTSDQVFKFLSREERAKLYEKSLVEMMAEFGVKHPNLAKALLACN